MEKEYIVGIDFGHGETAAWIVPYPDFMDVTYKLEEGKALALKKSTNNDFTLPSEVHVNTEGQYSLEEGVGNHAVVGLKGLPKELRKSKKDKAYSNFIMLIVERLLDYNEELLKKEGVEYNFDLCIATPTRWNEREQEDYIRFVNEAIKKTGIHVLCAINESDAAYFTHRDIQKGDEIVLVIDYGSSTIDYTLMQGDKKISDDEWSNTELGAHNVEEEIINTFIASAYDKMDFISGNEIYEDGETLWEKKFADQMRVIKETGQDKFFSERVVWDEFRRRCRKAKEQSFSNNELKITIFLTVLDRINMYKTAPISIYVNNINKLLGMREPDSCERGSYIYCVKEDFEKLKKYIRKKTGKERPDRIVLSGGACIMGWVKEVVKEVLWGEGCEIYEDKQPQFVVAKGISLYARQQKYALERLKIEVADLNYIDLYESADTKARIDTTKKHLPEFTDRLKDKDIHTGNDIREEFMDFFRRQNLTDQTYLKTSKESLERELSIEIGKLVGDIIERNFGAKIAVDNINIHIQGDLRNEFADSNFRKGGFLTMGGAIYEEITDYIKESGSYLYLFKFSFDKIRRPDDVQRIIDGTEQKILTRMFKYPSRYCRIRPKENDLEEQAQALSVYEILTLSYKNIFGIELIVNNIKEQTLKQVEDIFYSHQLFKTTFA